SSRMPGSATSELFRPCGSPRRQWPSNVRRKFPITSRNHWQMTSADEAQPTVNPDGTEPWLIPLPLCLASSRTPVPPPFPSRNSDAGLFLRPVIGFFRCGFWQDQFAEEVISWEWRSNPCKDESAVNFLTEIAPSCGVLAVVAWAVWPRG